MGQETSFTVNARGSVSPREGYWVATVESFPVITYGNTMQEAKERAIRATFMLCARHSDSEELLRAYLDKRGVSYSIASEEEDFESTIISQPYSQKMEVPVGAS